MLAVNGQLPSRLKPLLNLLSTMINCLIYCTKATLSSNKAYYNQFANSLFLKEVDDYLHNTKPQGRKITLLYLSGWQNNIKAIQVLLQRTSLNYPFPRRISQDVLGNLFETCGLKVGIETTIHASSLSRHIEQ